ncbi:MAG: hypothetical protein AVDCRST_MAG73-1390, partial [uncultured Thermomicrobiales bacterium]
DRRPQRVPGQARPRQRARPGDGGEPAPARDRRRPSEAERVARPDRPLRAVRHRRARGRGREPGRVGAGDARDVRVGGVPGGHGPRRRPRGRGAPDPLHARGPRV